MNLFGLTPTHVVLIVAIGTFIHRRNNPAKNIIKHLSINLLITIVVLAFIGVPVLETFKHPDAVWNASFTGNGEYTPTYPSDEKAVKFRETVEFEPDQ